MSIRKIGVRFFSFSSLSLSRRRDNRFEKMEKRRDEFKRDVTKKNVSKKMEEREVSILGERSARVIVRVCLAASPRPAGYRQDIFAQEMGSSIVCTFVQTVQLRGCAGLAVLSV